jgi:dihydroorotate dehydrogenase electron transfer subunit
MHPGQHDKKRGRFDAVVERNDPVCREHFLLRLRVRSGGRPFPPTRPGQFIQLGCREPNGAMDMAALLGRTLEIGPGQLPRVEQPEVCGALAMLRRPFSLAGRGDDEQGVWLEVIHRVVGVGTRWLSGLKPGDAVDLIGPLGNWFDLAGAIPGGAPGAGKSLGLLVGGGVGLPPMFYLAEALAAVGWRAIGFVGALTRDLLAVTFREGVGPDARGEPTMCADEFARHGFPTVITTDDGSLGLPGRITAGVERCLQSLSVEDAAQAVVFTCGPEPMMHAVAKLAKRHGVDCQVCLEQAMACGMSTCQSCVVRIEDANHPHGTTAEGRPWRYKLACSDGPVFPADVVVW